MCNEYYISVNGKIDKSLGYKTYNEARKDMEYIIAKDLATYGKTERYRIVNSCGEEV